jgi:hypothetical protein
MASKAFKGLRRVSKGLRRANPALFQGLRRVPNGFERANLDLFKGLQRTSKMLRKGFKGLNRAWKSFKELRKVFRGLQIVSIGV